MDIVVAILGGSLGAAIVTGAVSLITWRLNRKAAKEDKAVAQESVEAQKIDGIQAALRQLLYNDIKHQSKQHLADKYISTEDLEDILEMHRIYHDELEGNGFLDSVIKQVRHLPIIDCVGGGEKHD